MRTESGPATGEAAELIQGAIKNGTTVSNPEAEKTATRIAERVAKSRKKIYVKISRPGMGSYIQPVESMNVVLEEIQTSIDERDLKSKLVIELVEMTKEEHEALSDFDGW